MPSSKKARVAMLKLTADTGDGPIYELGSGWGNLLIPLGLAYPKRKIVGYELSFFPWLISSIIIKLRGLNNVDLYRKNFLSEDLSNSSVVLCYLYPEGMLRIEEKLKAEEGDLRYLISNNFLLPSHKPCKKIQLNDFYKSPVYLYRFK